MLRVKVPGGDAVPVGMEKVKVPLGTEKLPKGPVGFSRLKVPVGTV